jgi:hypothetical protein
MNLRKPSSGTGLGRACGLLFGIPWTIMSGGFLVFAIASAIEDPAHSIITAVPMILFPLAFAAIGLAMIGYSVIPWIAGMRVALPDITLSSDTVRVGESFTVHYSQTFKRKSDVKGIRISLILRERATYQSGKNSATATHEEVAAEYDFAPKVYEAGELLSFSRGMEIPRNGMHTFRGQRNQITWVLRVKVDVAGWPDYGEDFDLAVQPEMAR